MITNELISEIKSKINDNHKQAISGGLLQGVLVDMVKSLSEAYPQTYTDEQKAQARANIDALSNHNGEITKEKLSADVQAILDDVANKQNITDESLATIAKTIVGAINELFNGGVKDGSIATSKIEDGAITKPKLDTDLVNVITSAVQPAELASAIATALASYVAKADIVATTGSATDKVMSQNGVTEAINGVNNKVTELDVEINGKIVFTAKVQYASEPFSIFRNLTKGKTYRWQSPFPCGIEYYANDGSYRHLFDDQTSIEFICPSDYDETKNQFIINRQVLNGTCSIVDFATSIKSEISAIKSKLDKVEVETEIALIPNKDFEWKDGNIRDDGTIETTTAYWYTTPIKVNAGDVLHIKKNYGDGVNAISETDAEGTYYRPLYKNMEGVDDYKFPIEREGYVALCHNAQNEGFGVNYEASIISGGKENLMIASKGFTNNTIQALDNTTDTSFLSLAKDLEYEVSDRANISKALYDREVMLYEVKNSTDADILAQGVCGYDDSKGTRVDGTITWKIYKNGILYISGYGKTYDYIKGVMDGLSKSEVEAYQQEQPTMWYYGFVKEGVQYTYSDTGFSTTYSARVYDETTGEQMDERNGMYKGYAAPFYKYRTEVDFEEYTTHEIYNSHNPQGIKYNRICFDEDLANGGITSLGDWFLYRCCVDSVVLPSQLTSLRRWAVRYSPTISTVVMGDKVQFVEEYGLSRMESMETLKVSPNIERLDYSALVQNDNLRHLELPKVTYIEKWGIATNTKLEKLDISSLPYLRDNSLGGDKALQRVMLSNSLVGIESNNFFESAIQELVIPQECTTILTSAFYATYRLQKVTILSNHISSTIADNESHLFTYANRYLIPVGNDISEYIYGILKYMGVEDGYHIFIKL